MGVLIEIKQADPTKVDPDDHQRTVEDARFIADESNDRTERARRKLGDKTFESLAGLLAEGYDQVLENKHLDTFNGCCDEVLVVVASFSGKHCLFRFEYFKHLEGDWCLDTDRHPIVDDLACPFNWPAAQRHLAPRPAVPEWTRAVNTAPPKEPEMWWQGIGSNFPETSVQDLRSCSFSEWYPRFRAHTFRSEVIKPLSDEFIEYLLSDGIEIFDETEFPSYIKLGTTNTNADDEFWGSEAETSNDEESNKRSRKPDISDIDAKIRKAIQDLGGSDASWITPGNTLKCNSPSEIYLLLKASDKITNDLLDPVAANTPKAYLLGGAYVTDKSDLAPPELVLREWGTLYPSMEFRCFVRGRTFIGATQLDLKYYEHLDQSRTRIAACLQALFKQVIRDRFEVDTYCFDAYILKSMERAYVIDFNLWSPTTDPVLFSWSELLQEDAPFELRLVPKDLNIGTGITSRYSQNRFPIELTAEAYHSSLIEVAERLQQSEQDEAIASDDSHDSL
ncbi:hypothetical protein EV182_001012 [Spiromyces aspiralis]|uniref:Uncharacterized protein n=1 Tax=Spiromyces aspiralis TaxID=68401 RepID=A0ACC1HW12_9FUNG|nr:hypothetical protein EV182_001012 [Spiromyces aspiralis]